jgi:hypothetical protein
MTTVRWFRPFGIGFVPVSIIGWALTLVAFGFCAHIFLFVDGRSHSVSDALYGIFPFWVPALLALGWVADRSGGRHSN